MNGYIKKQALMDYCSNQVTRTIDLNDIARFPIAKVFTKDEVIAMLTEIREKAWYRHSKYEDEKDFEVDKAVEDIVNHIDAKINALKGEENVD